MSGYGWTGEEGKDRPGQERRWQERKWMDMRGQDKTEQSETGQDVTGQEKRWQDRWWQKRTRQDRTTLICRGQDKRKDTGQPSGRIRGLDRALEKEEGKNYLSSIGKKWKYLLTPPLLFCFKNVDFFQRLNARTYDFVEVSGVILRYLRLEVFCLRFWVSTKCYS
jgi:hypothetical protein